MIDDRTLLSRYAAHRDEEAFAEVVRRHLPFVYSTALRRLDHDTHRAEDVAQAVFCVLARDALRVARYPVLSGWLHTATRNAALNIVRGEKRRRGREVEACHMQQIESEAGAPPDWSQLRPVLDAAMDRLNARDREAILLRFFESRTFGEIGAIAGSSEDAARKRVDRALAKLRDLLRPRGIVSTSATLAALLASQPVSAAPAGLLAEVTGAALATGGTSTAGIGTFIAMTKLQAGIAAAIIVVAAISLVSQHRTIGRLRDDLARTQSLAVASGGQAGVDGKRSGRYDAASTHAHRGADTSLPATALRPAAPGDLRNETGAALKLGKVPERYVAFVTALRKLSRDNWREVLQAFEDERKRTGLGHPEVFEIFARRAGEVVGKDVVNYFLKQGWTGDASEAMIGWASRSPEEALHWLSREVDVPTRRIVMGAAIRGLAMTEPDLAVKTLEEQPANERYKYSNELITSMLRAIEIDEAQRLVEGMVTRAAQTGRLKEDYLRYVFTDYSLKRIAQSAANGTISETAAWLTQYVGQPYLDRQSIAQAAVEFARQDPQETFRWLEGVNATLLRAGAENTVGYRVLMDVWQDKAGAPVVEAWLQSRALHPHYDHMAWQYAALIVEQDANKAVKWANTIKDPAIRQKALQAVDRRAVRGKS